MNDAKRVLLLAPSGGLGGGIERYLHTVSTSLESDGTEVTRVDLLAPGVRLTVSSRLRFALRAAVAARHVDAILAGHPDLVYAAFAAKVSSGGARTVVVGHGTDAWGISPLERSLGGLGRMHFVGVSGFSAGTLSGRRPAGLLPPGIDASWRDRLIAAGGRRSQDRPGVLTILTVFRFDDWRMKGLPELLAALSLCSTDVPLRLVVAGRGPVPADLADMVVTYPFAELVESPPDHELAGFYAEADLFVLATRTRMRQPLTGEGFGLVLLEAQLAGCPVIGPAFGGSREAYVEGVTGVTPADESPRALADVLASVLRDRDRLAGMGACAASWAELSTRASAHRSTVRTVVLGAP